MAQTLEAPKQTSVDEATPPHRAYVPDDTTMPELTWPALLVGVILGIVFGASSLYLVLKVGLTVSASIPVAVLSITLFRAFSRVFGIRRATILENNVVQTTGSAGESIAFGVGVTMPALMLLGFDMEVTRVMTVGVLGGLLGILMMIPLRRAFIVKQHRRLAYPEGTACAGVLIVGEEGGATAKTVFAGFGLAFVYKFCMQALHLWNEAPSQNLYTSSGQGLRGGVIGGEVAPELLGVGYIIGPKVASIMLAGGVLAYLVLVPTIVLFGENVTEVLPPAKDLLIREMSVSKIRDNYILYIGAGAVATAGIVSMFQAMPLIIGSIRSGLRDLRSNASVDGPRATGRAARTERDLPLSFVVFGSLALLVALTAMPNLGLGFSQQGIIGALLILLFGFLFVTVSSRLTGEIGSSSNPISGMTVATLLLTCLIFVAIGQTDKPATLTALTVAAIVCVAASNGGTTSQDLKTGYLVGGTPSSQQIAIIVGSLTSALVIGVTLLLLNEAGTVYTKRAEYIPDYRVADVSTLAETQRVGGEYAATDQTMYRVLHVAEGELEGVAPGKYLVDDSGQVQYFVDPAINGIVKVRDDGTEVRNKFEAPKTRLMWLIINGIMKQELPWGLVLIGALIAVTLELAGVASLPFAVGVYLPIQVSVPIFVGGAVRWCVDKIKRRSSAEGEMSPGVLLSSGYIAGGAIAGVVVAFFAFAPDRFQENLNVGKRFSSEWTAGYGPTILALTMFGLLVLILALVGLEKMLRSRIESAGGPAIQVKR